MFKKYNVIITSSAATNI